MAMKKPGKKKVGDAAIGTTPSGRNVTMGGRVMDPTTGTPFVKGQPHPTPKPMSIVQGFGENLGKNAKPAPAPKAKPKAPPSKIVGFGTRKGMLADVMNDRTMGGGKKRG